MTTPSDPTTPPGFQPPARWAWTRPFSYAQNASWISLSASALRQNVAELRALRDTDGTGGAVRLGTVLKGNAYGHGFVETLSLVHPLVDVIYVITPQDGLCVRAFEADTGAPRKRVLVIGATEPSECVALARADVDVTIGDMEFERSCLALRAAGIGRKARAHVHVDTGLSREGFTLDDLARRFPRLLAYADVVDIVGLLSHFANTEDVTEQAYALEQVRVFTEASGLMARAHGFSEASLERHFAASAATLVLHQAHFDTVRVGIALYGLWPSSETRLSARIMNARLPKLTPVLSWHCRSQVVKSLPAGSFVGYGCTYRCEQPTRIAVLPVGYFDGYPRLVSGKAHVLVNGRRAPVLGRVMMNHIVVDVTLATSDDSPITATLLGTDGHEAVSAEMLAAWSQSIHYELVTRLGPHLKRIIVDS